MMKGNGKEEDSEKFVLTRMKNPFLQQKKHLTVGFTVFTVDSPHDRLDGRHRHF